MELLKEKIVKKVIPLIDSPVISTERHVDNDLGVSFYSIYLSFNRILDFDQLKKELGFTMRESEVEEILHNKRLKLEDVFAKYINDHDNENEMASKDAEKISSGYTQLIKSEKLFS